MKITAHATDDFVGSLPDPEQIRFSADYSDVRVQAEFLTSTADRLADMEQNVLRWETNPADEEAADTVRRHLHSIKGDAGFVGLPEVSEACHELESLIQEKENDAAPPVDTLLATKDWLDMILGHLSGERPDEAKPAPVPPAGKEQQADQEPHELADEQPAADEAPAEEKVEQPVPVEDNLKILIVEDDFVNRRLLTGLLEPYGQCDIAVNGKEANEAFRRAWKENMPYDLICLDIMMPDVDGQQALGNIRMWEQKSGIALGKGVKIVMTTVLDDPENIFGAFNAGCESYLVKPIAKKDLLDAVRNLGLIR